MITDLIGIPFANKGRSLEGMDCWGLVMHLHKESTGEDLPDFIYTKADNDQNSLYFVEQVMQSQWVEATPSEGVVVVFKIAGIMRHAGCMLDNHRFIHVLRNTHVVIESIKSPVWRDRVAGYWRYNGS